MPNTYDNVLMKLNREFDLVHTSQIDDEVDRTTEVLGRTLGVDRVGVWLFNEDQNEIECKSLFVLDSNQVTRGEVFKEADNRPYFKALLEQRSIKVIDAKNDPITSCFKEGYLIPQGISSMYDIPIWKAGKAIGVLCLEYKELKTKWHEREERLITSVADFIAKIYEKFSVLELVENLERNVRLRTIELEQAMNQLKQTQEFLVEKEKLAVLGSVVAGISHELKNPLNLIISSSKAILDINEKEPNKKIASMAQIINDAAMRADNIIVDMLGQAGDKEKLSDINLRKLIEFCLKLTLHDVVVNSITPQVSIDIDEEIVFKACRQKMQRVFINLFDNSLFALGQRFKNTKNEAKLEISAEVVEDSIIIKIRDNGTGISPSDLRNIFIPFYSTKGDHGGTGLGMSLVYDIVKKHEGHISIDSIPNKFTEVTLHLKRTL